MSWVKGCFAPWITEAENPTDNIWSVVYKNLVVEIPYSHVFLKWIKKIFTLVPIQIAKIQSELLLVLWTPNGKKWKLVRYKRYCTSQIQKYTGTTWQTTQNSVLCIIREYPHNMASIMKYRFNSELFCEFKAAESWPSAPTVSNLQWAYNIGNPIFWVLRVL